MQVFSSWERKTSTADRSSNLPDVEWPAEKRKAASVKRAGSGQSIVAATEAQRFPQKLQTVPGV